MIQKTKLKDKPNRVRIPVNYASINDIAYESGRTDASNAERFVDRFSDKLLFIPKWNKWLNWDGCRWAEDSGTGVHQRAKLYSKSLWGDVGRLAEFMDRSELGPLQTFVKQSNQAGKIRSFLELARSDERVVCQVDQLDNQPTWLNVANGTIDLDNGTIKAHSPADKITQIANVKHDPKAQCTQWLSTLNLIFAGDEKLVRYVQQLLGYSISGIVSEEVLPVCYGLGCNGKSTLWNCVLELLGDYGRAASADLLLPDKNPHPTIIAGLYKKRFVPIGEPAQGRELSESMAKMLSSTDRIEARRMREDQWEFFPTHKIWIPTNHKPRIKGTDDGIWRRVKLIPFTVDLRKVTTPKKGFATWLAQNEGSGILNWLIAGYQDWRAHGFAEPRAVTVATNDYRANEDTLGEFLNDHCVVDDQAIGTAAELFECYSVKHGGKWTKTFFGKAMAERFKKDKPTNGQFRRQVIYHGVRLQDENSDIPEENENWHQLAPVSLFPLRVSANPIGVTTQLVPTSAKTEIEPDPDDENGGLI